MMKNIMIISRALTYGGAERVAASLASYLTAYYNVDLVVIDGDKQSYHTTANTIYLGQSVIHKGKGINRILWFVNLYKKILRLRKSKKYECVISFLTEPELMNALTSQFGKSITSIRNVRSSVVCGRIKKIRDKWAFSKMDGIVSLSENAKKDLVENYDVKPDKIRVIYNICDKEYIWGEISKGIIENDISEWLGSGKVFVTTGRLSEQKAQWHMIRAFAGVAKKHPDVKLAILGKGEQEEYLSNLIGELDMAEQIRVLGFKSNPYIYLSKAYCFLFSSVFEGLGNSIVEAMACGLPIISTDCNAGPRELLSPDSSLETKIDEIELAEYGILTPVCDGIHRSGNAALTSAEEELKKAIELMVENEAIYKNYKQKSTERGEQFDIESIVNQWISVNEQ